MLDTYARGYLSCFFSFCAKILAQYSIKPMHITFASLLFGLIGALCLFLGFYITSLVLLWISGLCDVLDGELARLSKSTSQKGALLDIFFDRIVEIAYILAFVKVATPLSLLILSSSIILSMTIFLSVGAMSKKESKKEFYYQAGLMERTEGFILFSSMIIFYEYATYISFLFAFLIFITIFQRLMEALKVLE